MHYKDTFFLSFSILYLFKRKALLHYLEFFCIGDQLSPQLIYSVTLYQHGLMAILLISILWFIIQKCIAYFLAQIVLVLAIEDSFS